MRSIGIICQACQDPIPAGGDIGNRKAGVTLSSGVKEAQNIFRAFAFCGNQINAQTRRHRLTFRN